MALAEGVRVVEEALAAGVEMHGSLVSPALERTARGAALLADLAAHAVPIEEVTERAFGELADTEHPQGVLALVTAATVALENLVPTARSPVLVLDGVRDPGNAGTLLRTAFALGAAGAVLLKGSADVTNAKVIRSAMGATFRLPIARAEEGELVHWAARNDVALWAAASEGSALGGVPGPDRLALVVGNEGAGVADGLAAAARLRVAIPLARGAESLNVAVAAGIMLYEVIRRA
jgi:TrmH family RNA methyltransferase